MAYKLLAAQENITKSWAVYSWAPQKWWKTRWKRACLRFPAGSRWKQEKWVSMFGC